MEQQEPVQQQTPPPADSSTQRASQEVILGKFKDEAQLDASLASIVQKLDVSGIVEVPGEFAAKVKLYEKLEAKLGSGGRKPAATDAGQTPPPATTPTDTSIGQRTQGQLPDDASVQQILDHVGVKQADLASQWAANGALTDEQYALFKNKLNAPRAMVDAYIANEQAAAKATSDAIMEKASQIAGGETQRNTILQWAKANITEEEATWYDSQLSTPDSAIRAFEWLASKYTQTTGGSRSRGIIEVGSTGRQMNETPFRTQAELSSAMADERYAPVSGTGHVNRKYDASYREQVLSRLKRTNMDTLNYA